MYVNKFVDIGEGLHEGKVGEIFVKEGQKIKEGDPLFSVETDKITSDIPCPVDGTIVKILIQTGQTIHVGDETFYIDDGSSAKIEAKPITSPTINIEQRLVQPEIEEQSIIQQNKQSVSRPTPSIQQQNEFEVDAIVIGTGPGGYTLVESLGEGGLKVIAIEKEYVGGVCLNVGCIPTKALLRSAKLTHYIEEASVYGIDISSNLIQLNWNKMQERKAQVVNTLTKGVETIIKKAKAEFIKGEAIIVDKNTIKVNDRLIKTKYIIIASGSSPIELTKLPGFEDAMKRGIILNSTSVLSLEKIPSKITIVGGGVIGVEFACLFRSMKSDVTIIEGSSSILGPLDLEVKKVAHKMLEDQGIKIYTNAFVKSYENDSLVYELNGKKETIQSEKILVSVGRRVNNLNVDKIGIELNQDKSIKVDAQMRTSIPNIYAIGDVINEVMLAHAAYKHSQIAAESILHNRKISHSRKNIPSCIYSYPEISSIGYTEEELQQKNIPYIKAVWQNAYLGKSIADGDTFGFTKFLVGKKYGEILGAYIISANSSDMISEVSLAMESELTIYEICNTIHPHPSTSEGIFEAAKIAKLLLEKSREKN